MHLRWSRPGKVVIPGSAGMWGMSLELLTSSSRRRGMITIHRLYREQPLQLDINLLTSEFPTVLADALDRIITHEAIVLPTASAKDGLMEAQAG
jgi:hypothetical protein